MKNLTVMFLLLDMEASASAQTNNLTFTNNSGAVYSNVTVIKIERDGVLFRLPEGVGHYGRVKFTNMSQSLQLQFGYDPEKLRKAEEDRIAKAKADREEQIAKARAAQYDSIKVHRRQIEPIDESDFPKLKWRKQLARKLFLI